MVFTNRSLTRALFGTFLLVGICASHLASAMDDRNLPIFYSENHNIEPSKALECYTGGKILSWLGIGKIISYFGNKLHSFNGHKYSDAIKILYQKGIVKAYGKMWGDYKVQKPDGEVSQEHLERVHTKEYLNSLKNDGKILGNILEIGDLTPYIAQDVIDHVILRPMRYQVRSTEMAVEYAAKNKCNVAVLGGGFHHAGGNESYCVGDWQYKKNEGEGFCVYNDAAVAIEDQWVRDAKAGLAKTKFMIVDTDAHMGNGNAHYFGEKGLAYTPSNKGIFTKKPVAIFDMYGTERRGSNFGGSRWFTQYPLSTDPKAVDYIAYPNPLKNREHQENGAKYLAILQNNLHNAIDEYNPNMLI
jgi:acetoin utilization deacetylase AcuC-like enzyme